MISFEARAREKQGILDEAFNLVYYAGFNFSEVWRMPVKYRRHFTKRLKEVKDKEKSEIEKQKRKMK